MTTVEAMQRFLCYVKNDGTVYTEITQNNAADLWEQIGLAFNARFNSGTSQIASLTLTSELGEATGTTKITVSGASGTLFRYKVNVDLPAYGADLSGWTAWNGTSEIAVEDGCILCIAEVDESNLAIAAGRVTANSNV